MLQFEKARELVMRNDFWKNLDTAYRTLKPAYLALRYSDGMTGSSLALLYDQMLKLDEIYNNEISGLDEDIRKQVLLLWQNRWNAFHAPIHTAAWCMSRMGLSPLRTFDKNQADGKRIMADLCAVMVDFCKAPGCPTSYNKLKSEYAAFNKAVALQQVCS